MLCTFPLRNSRHILGWYIKENRFVYHLCWSKLPPGRVPSVWRSPSLGLTSPPHLFWKSRAAQTGPGQGAHGPSSRRRVHRHPVRQRPPRSAGRVSVPVDSCHVTERLLQVFLPLAFTTQHIRPWSVCEEPWILLESWLICWTFQAQILRVTV